MAFLRFTQYERVVYRTSSGTFERRQQQDFPQRIGGRRSRQSVFYLFNQLQSFDDAARQKHGTRRQHGIGANF